MIDTDFYLKDLKDGSLHRFGTSYVPSEVNGEVCLAATSEKTVGPKTEFAAGGDLGGVLSTASDYARFG